MGMRLDVTDFFTHFWVSLNVFNFSWYLMFSRMKVNTIEQQSATTIFLSSNSAFFIDQNQTYTLIITYIVCGLQKAFQYRWFLVSLVFLVAFMMSACRLFSFSYPLLTFFQKTAANIISLLEIGICLRFLMLPLVLTTLIFIDNRVLITRQKKFKDSINTTTVPCVTPFPNQRACFKLHRDNFFIRLRCDKKKFSHKSCLITFWIKSYLS